MKILQINKYLYPKGGSETYMFQLSKTLQELGHEVKFWGMKDSRNIVCDFPDNEVRHLDFSKENNVQGALKALSTIYSFRNKNKLSKVLDIFKPDLVHIHNYNLEITPSILPEIKKRGIQIVQTVHDSKMVCANHKLYNFEKNETCTKCVTSNFSHCVKDKCFDGSLIKSALGALESSLYTKLDYYNKYIDRFIVPSNFLANLLKNKINVKKIKVIPNFVDINVTKTTSPKEKFILYYGRISQEKGVLELVDIFIKMDVKLIIIGSGPQKELLEEKIKSFSHITYLGPKYNEDLFNFIQQATYVIQPSIWYENCPMTILESFALGVPVIGANHSGIKELIQHEETGYLLDFKNTEETIKQLKKIVVLPTDKLKDTIKKNFKDNYGKTNHISKVLEVYTKLVE